MSTAEKIVNVLQTFSEPNMLKVLEYMEFLQYQQEKEADQGLKIAQERSAAYDRGESKPVSKKVFWENLQEKLG